MDLTIQILTKNNEKSINQTVNSIKPLNANIVINDLGSTDNTIKIAKSLGCVITNYKFESRSDIRNHLCQQFNTKWHMFLEPNEYAISSLQPIIDNNKDICYFSILTNNILRKDIRLWNNHKNIKFKNPIFEILNIESNDDLQVVFCSDFVNYNYELELINWKKKEPTNPIPYYYESILALNKGDIDTFVNKSEYFLFLEPKKNSIPYVMNRYYYALVSLHQKQVKKTLQNINLCIAANSLMAEFWCIVGDVYYHLLNDFDKAIDFYENAIILGSRRKKSSKWPMDILKYKEYPNSMIESCNKIKKNYYVVKHLNISQQQ